MSEANVSKRGFVASRGAVDYPLKKRLFRNEAIQHRIGAGGHIAKSCLMCACRTGASTWTQPWFWSCQKVDHRIQELGANLADVATRGGRPEIEELPTKTIASPPILCSLSLIVRLLLRQRLLQNADLFPESLDLLQMGPAAIPWCRSVFVSLLGTLVERDGSVTPRLVSFDGRRCLVGPGTR
jgi:hypothetical protein